MVVAADGTPIHWHVPNDRSAGFLPDSRDLWDVLWENRGRLGGFAHSHPGSGFPSPSHTDVTTFAAIEAALGKKIDWWVVTKDRVGLVVVIPPDAHGVKVLREDPPWLGELRRLSY